MVCSRYPDLIMCVPNYDFLSLLMAFYSYIPIVLFPCLFFWFVYKRTTPPLLAMSIFLFAVLFNEGILKPIIRQPRPVGSCACSYGMPSGHSDLAFLFMTWVVLECVFPLNLEWGLRRRVFYSALVVALGAPIPYSRVYLLYHTPEQVGVGLSEGIVLGVVYFLLLRMYLISKLPVLCSWKHTAFIKNTYMRSYVPINAESGPQYMSVSIYESEQQLSHEWNKEQ